MLCRHQPFDRGGVYRGLRAQSDRDEAEIARTIREASPTAMPNARIVSIADRLLKRDGRMVSAVETRTGRSAWKAIRSGSICVSLSWIV